MTRPTAPKRSPSPVRRASSRPRRPVAAVVLVALAVVLFAVVPAACGRDLTTQTRTDAKYGYSFTYDGTRLVNGGATGVVDPTALEHFVLYDHGATKDPVAAFGMTIFAGNGIDPTLPQIKQIAVAWNKTMHKLHPGKWGYYRLTRFFPDEPGLVLATRSKMEDGKTLVSAEYTWFEARYWYRMHLQALRSDWPAENLFFQDTMRTLKFVGMGAPGPPGTPPPAPTPASTP